MGHSVALPHLLIGLLSDIGQIPAPQKSYDIFRRLQVKCILLVFNLFHWGLAIISHPFTIQHNVVGFVR